MVETNDALCGLALLHQREAKPAGTDGLIHHVACSLHALPARLDTRVHLSPGGVDDAGAPRDTRLEPGIPGRLGDGGSERDLGLRLVEGPDLAVVQGHDPVRAAPPPVLVAGPEQLNRLPSVRDAIERSAGERPIPADDNKRPA